MGDDSDAANASWISAAASRGGPGRGARSRACLRSGSGGRPRARRCSGRRSTKAGEVGARDQLRVAHVGDALVGAPGMPTSARPAKPSREARTSRLSACVRRPSMSCWLLWSSPGRRCGPHGLQKVTEISVPVQVVHPLTSAAWRARSGRQSSWSVRGPGCTAALAQTARTRGPACHRRRWSGSGGRRSGAVSAWRSRSNYADAPR